MSEPYPELRAVQNTCPRCGNKSIYHLRFKYDDEGKMLCTNCQAQDRNEIAEDEKTEARLSQLLQDIKILKERDLL